jgi:hypothetical protein
LKSLVLLFRFVTQGIGKGQSVKLHLLPYWSIRQLIGLDFFVRLSCKKSKRVSKQVSGTFLAYIGIRVSNLKVKMNNCLLISKKGQKAGQKVATNVLFGQEVDRILT